MHLTAYIARENNGWSQRVFGHFASREAAERCATRRGGVVDAKETALIAQVFSASARHDGVRCLVRIEMSLGLAWDFVAWVHDDQVSYGGACSTNPKTPDWVAEFMPLVSADILSQI